MWGLTLLLGIARVRDLHRQLHGLPAPDAPIHIPWPIIAAAFAAAELKVVEVHFRRETHSFSLSEFPAVIGLFFLSPSEYVLAVLTGSAAAMLFASGQRPIKVAFNLANFALIAVVSYTIVAAIVAARRRARDPRVVRRLRGHVGRDDHQLRSRSPPSSRCPAAPPSSGSCPR